MSEFIPQIPEQAPTLGYPQQMRIQGIHHVTMIVSDLQRTTAFYRDTLGLSLVNQTYNHDDPNARHFYFGDQHGTPGTLVSFLEYPKLPAGTVGAGSIHHIAFTVSSRQELEAWVGYLRSRGVQCSDVFDRKDFVSIYFKDPDGNTLELTA